MAPPARRRPGRRLAVAVFVGYVVLSLLLRKRMPFSEFSMYANATSDKSVLVFDADGAPARLFAYDDFVVDAAALDPARVGFVMSEHYMVDETHNYVLSHAASVRAPGSVPVEFRVRRTHYVPATGKVLSEERVLCAGWARRAR